MDSVVAPELRRTGEAAPGRTLAVVAASTVLTLAAFVTPLATGVRTAADLGTGPAGQAWLLSAMSVGLAAALLVAGVAADDLGQRRVFASGLVLLAAGAGITAAAGSTAVFVAGRLVEGVGGAAVLAATLGLISQAFPAGPERARAAALWGASVGAGTGIGGIATVVLDPGSGWRTTHVVTAGLAVVAAVVARLVLPASGPRRHRRVDVAGTVLLVAALSCLLSGLVETRAPSGGGLATVVLVLSGVLLVAFVVVEARVREPLVDLALFRVRGFVAASVGALVTGAAIVGLMSYLPSVLQRGLGESLLSVTLLVLVWSAVSTATALAVRRLPGLDGRVLLALGLALSAAGLAALAVLGAGASGIRFLPGLLVLGVGYGAANAALGREAVAHVPPARAGMGSGANNTARYVGAAVGVTVVVLVVGTGTPEQLAGGWNAAALGAAAVSALGALVVAALRPARRLSGARADR
ncbi:MFS transporter [Petropleomorpha daqingensis]|uniref:MFS family permease n=1 Tax=Petropleomorpha daqingensis TaxID=2026353 RepID=A0A853CLJ7_9ACTN|nr:MFS transporter [Petropleomorpha daqingensis]NYJ08785.1 MFS family permease [Petropleomorpha daqingensis]